MNAPRGIPVWIALLGSGLAGILVASQSRLNGGLGATIDNGILAAAVSFGAGLLVMVLAISLSPNGRAGLGRVRAGVRERGFPLWALLGGLCGAFFVITQGVAVGVLGVALFTVGIVAGQVVGGLVLDRIGLGPGGRVMPTVPRMFGAVLAVIAVAVSAWTGLGEASGVALLILPLLAGLAVSWQSAVNGLVRSVAESAITATFVNFVIGTVALTVAAAVSVGLRGWPTDWPGEWWWYAGGPLGCVFIALAAIFVRSAGVLLLSMSNVAGQLVGALVLDAVAPVPGRGGSELLLGVGIALVAVVIACLPSRDPART